jgi:Zn-dependent protease with chaperone function
MDSRLWRKIVLCGSITIATVAVAIFGIGYFAHLQIGLVPAILASLAMASILYWVSRYEYGLLWLFTAIFVGIFLAVVFQDYPSEIFPNVSLPDNLDKKSSRKAERRAKLNFAIARRKTRLEELLA